MGIVNEGAYRSLRLWLAQGAAARAVHAMGARGVGMAGVCAHLRARGWQVTGCDRAITGAGGDWLATRGVAVLEGHSPAHLDAPCDLLLRSAAIADDHPELQRARALRLPVARRGEALAALLGERGGVAVCGTHGKTTTACFVTRLLQSLGAEPTWCIGGSTAALGGVAGTEGAGLLVVEADESDGTLALYEPDVTVVTNIDADHLDHFGGLAALRACFAAVVARTRRSVVFCADDAAALEVCGAASGAIGFGCAAAARLRITRLDLRADGALLSARWDGRALGTVNLRVAGRHNALNALGALATAIALGHDPDAAWSALGALDELPGRRFQVVAERRGIRVVSDYSHHPAEIAALVALARLQGARRLLALFQPHRYSRTRALAESFPAAFAGVDELLLAPVYAASEAPLDGGLAEDLYRAFRAQPQPGLPLPRLASSLTAAWEWLRRELRAGDLLLVVGAGDVNTVAQWAAAELGAQPEVLAGAATAAPAPRRTGAQAAFVPAPRRRRADASLLEGIGGVQARAGRPLAALTTLGVGGAADLLVDVATPAALAEVLRRCRASGLPWHLLAGGSNTLVDDLGVRGVTLRLRGDAFTELVYADGVVTAGCGWVGAALLERLTEAGLGGLEFLDGVPGRLGGWLAMNAGAHGGAIGAHVTRISLLRSDGTAATIPVAEAGFAYRRCAALEGSVAVSAELRLNRDDAASVAARRADYRRRRLDFGGWRTAGSVFRNPPRAAAGELLENAGCKGLRVGGAMVYERHANVIVAAPGATASDVLALTALMRRRVREACGVELTPEIRHLQ